MIAFLAYCAFALPMLLAIFGWQQMALGNIIASVLLWLFAGVAFAWVMKLAGAMNK